MRPALLLALAGCGLIAQTTPPRPTHQPNPEYPDEARIASVECSVGLKLVIAADGRPRYVNVTKPCGYGLDERAVETVRTWVFEPALKDGKAVDFPADIQVNYRLGGTVPPWQAGPMLFAELEGAGRPVLREAVFPDRDMPARPGARFTLGFEVNERGSVENVILSAAEAGETDEEARRLAMDAVRRWTFAPARRDGKPVRAKGTLVWYSAARQ